MCLFVCRYFMLVVVLCLIVLFRATLSAVFVWSLPAKLLIHCEVVISTSIGELSDDDDDDDDDDDADGCCVLT